MLGSISISFIEGCLSRYVEREVTRDILFRLQGENGQIVIHNLRST